MVITVQQEKLLTVSDVAVYLNIKQKTIYAKVSAGEIPHYKIGALIRFRLNEIDEWLSDCRKKNQPEEAQQKSKHKRRKLSKLPNDHFSRIIAKTIDSETNNYYSNNHGKSDLIEGPKKEINNGSI